MDDHLKRVKAVPFWGFWAEGTGHGLPDGMVGAAPVGCENPKCSTGCPSVAVSFVVQGHRYELRLDAEPARNLAAVILECANAQATKKVN